MNNNKNKNKNKKRNKNVKRNFKRKPRAKREKIVGGLSQTEKRDVKLLGDVSSTDPSVGVSQRNVIKVVTEASKEDFIRLAAVWPLFAVKNSMPNDIINLNDYGDVGSMYIMFVGICYDLYLAMRNQQTMFTKMPRLYKELRDALLPKTVNGTSYSWKLDEICFGSGGFINTLLPYVEFASLSWFKSSGPLDTLYDFFTDGNIIITDTDAYNLCPNIIQEIWLGLDQRVPIDMIGINTKTGFERCCGPFSQQIDLSYDTNIGWIASIIEEAVPNSQYWTRFLGLVPVSDTPNTRTGIHAMNDYKGAHQYAGHLERWDYDMTLGKNVKTLYRPKSFSFEEIATYTLTMLLGGDLYNTEQPFSIDPNTTGKETVFNDMSQSQFLRYILIVCATRFTQEGWTTFAFRTCAEQVPLVAGVNLTPYSDMYNIPVPRALAEYFGSIGVKKSTYRSGKSGYRIVNIPQLCVYGNTLGNVYQNAAYTATPTTVVASDLVPLLQIMSPRIIGTGPYAFAGPPTTLPDYLNVNTLVTLSSVSVDQTRGTEVIDAIQQVGEAMNAMKGFVTVSVSVANKDDVPFTVLYYTRIITGTERTLNFSLIYNNMYMQLTNRVNFDQRILGNHLGVPLPITCVPLPLHQVIFGEHTVTVVNNETPFFKLTIRSAQQFCHPKESTGDTSDFELMNKTVTAQGEGGNFFKMGAGMLKRFLPIAGGLAGNFIPGAGDIANLVSELIPE
jgi:hypothetical protein